MAAPKRPRAGATPESLASTLRPFITRKTWLSYGEKPSSQVNRLMISAHQRLILAIKSDYDNLSLTKSVADSAFGLLAHELGPSIKLEEDHYQDWATTMSARLRCMLRHVNQGVVKKNQWAVNLLGPNQDDENNGEEEVDDDERKGQPRDDPDSKPATTTTPKSSSATSAPTPEAAAAATRATTSASKQWLCGFSWEHHEAWRIAPDRRGPRQVTKNIYCKSEGPNDPMVAKFDDGYECELPDLLQKAWLELKKNMDGAKARKTSQVFTGVRKHDESCKVHVSYRPERPGHEIFGIYGNGKQLTMISLSRFDGNKEQAQAMAVELAKIFVQENITKAELVAKRNEMYPPKAAKSTDPSMKKAPDDKTKVIKKPAGVEEQPGITHVQASEPDDKDQADGELQGDGEHDHEQDDEHIIVEQSRETGPLHDMRAAIPIGFMDSSDDDDDGFRTPM